MTQEEHLNRIVAKCRELLAIAEKRTPGKWDHYCDRVCSDSEFHDEAKVDNVDVCQGITWRKDSPKQKVAENLLFIANCAGPAEAGWRATIAKCEFIQSYRKIRFGYDGDCGATRLVDEMESQLTAAWPEELL